MCVTMGKHGRRRVAAGFTLLEVVIAAGLLLTTIAAITMCVTSVSRGGARLQAAMDAERAARVVAERLRGLPFCAAAYPAPGAVTGPGADDLVAAVFPHARLSDNTEVARYVAGGEEDHAAPGSFVTLVDEGGVEVRCVAQFLRSEGEAALGPSEVGGWSVTDESALPGAVLLVRITAASRGTPRVVTLLRTALGAPPVRLSSVAAPPRASSVEGAPS